MRGEVDEPPELRRGCVLAMRDAEGQLKGETCLRAPRLADAETLNTGKSVQSQHVRIERVKLLCADRKRSGNKRRVSRLQLRTLYGGRHFYPYVSAKLGNRTANFDHLKARALEERPKRIAHSAAVARMGSDDFDARHAAGHNHHLFTDDHVHHFAQSGNLIWGTLLASEER